MTRADRVVRAGRLAALSLLLLVTLLVGIPAPEAYAAPVTFGPVTNYPTGGRQTRSLATGDFNGDGNLDLVATNNLDNNVSVFLGVGTGSFGVAARFPVQVAPRSVAVGDFNDDGALDLAVANFGSNSVSILLGSGTGAFGAATNVAVGTGPQAVALGDFNSDTILDLATANSTSNNLTIRVGTGTGGFGPASTFGLGGGTAPFGVSVGDFNFDGNADLVVANSGSNNVSILMGAGTGVFGPAKNVAVGASPRKVAVGDFNEDGSEDLAVANQASNNVSVLLGTGTGAFAPATAFAAGTQPFSVAASDLDLDGNQDLVTSDSGGGDSGNRISVLVGSGTGSFGAPTSFPMGTQPQFVVAADFNHDGRPDVATANNGSDNVSVRLNTTVVANLMINVPVGPTSAGNGFPGTQLSQQIGPVTVTDNRSSGSNLWTVTVEASDFTTSTTPVQTISNADISYWSGGATGGSGGGFVPGQPTAGDAVPLSSSQTAFSRTSGTGVNTVTWNPTVVINIPAEAVARTYVGTVYHSVG